MLSLPLGLLFLCANILGNASGAEAEQCRLVLQHESTSSARGAVPVPTGTSVPNATTSSPSPSATSATNTSFNYGQDIIRGVNLWVRNVTLFFKRSPVDRGGWFVLEVSRFVQAFQCAYVYLR
jgi:hypothetical protein